MSCVVCFISDEPSLSLSVTDMNSKQKQILPIHGRESRQKTQAIEIRLGTLLGASIQRRKEPPSLFSVGRTFAFFAGCRNWPKQLFTAHFHNEYRMYP